jgi:hypothetical protein
LQAWFPALLLLDLGFDIGDLEKKSARSSDRHGGGKEAYCLRRLGLDDEFLLFQILLPTELVINYAMWRLVMGESYLESELHGG